MPLSWGKDDAGTFHWYFGAGPDLKQGNSEKIWLPVENMMRNEDHVMFFDEDNSVLRIDRAHLKPHFWRGPQSFSSMCNPKAPGPFTISLINGKFELGRNMWGGSGLVDIVDHVFGKAYMLKAASFLSHALDESEKNAEKARQEAVKENEEWKETISKAAHSTYVDEKYFPPDVSQLFFENYMFL